MQERVQSVETIITQAIEKGVALDQMERFLDMRDRVLKEQARAAFVQAMAQFQAECPVIEKTKKVLNKNSTTTRYVYAPIDSIVKQIQKPVANAQLSYRFEVNQEPGKIKAVCLVTHVLGHTESSSFEVPITNSEYMTNVQSVAAAMTFAKRYALLNALGISTGDEDTDATTTGKEAAPKSLKSQIVFALRALKQKANTKEEIAAGVEKYTGFILDEKNYPQIVDKLNSVIRQNDLDHETATIR